MHESSFHCLTFAEGSLTSSDENPSYNERGFYIALDGEGPKRPKPPLRTRSPAKRRESGSSLGGSAGTHRRDLTTEYIQSIVDHVPIHKEEDDESDGRYYHHEAEICDAKERASGELVIDEKPHMDPVRIFTSSFHFVGIKCSYGW